MNHPKQFKWLTFLILVGIPLQVTWSALAARLVWLLLAKLRLKEILAYTASDRYFVSPAQFAVGCGLIGSAASVGILIGHLNRCSSIRQGFRWIAILLIIFTLFQPFWQYFVFESVPVSFAFLGLRWEPLAARHSLSDRVLDATWIGLGGKSRTAMDAIERENDCMGIKQCFEPFESEYVWLVTAVWISHFMAAILNIILVMCDTFYAKEQKAAAKAQVYSGLSSMPIHYFDVLRRDELLSEKNKMAAIKI